MLSKSELELTRIQKLAEDFAKLRSSAFLRVFLKDSGILQELYSFYVHEHQNEKIMSVDRFEDHLVKDYEMIFGQAIAISYSLGHIDQIERVSRDLYNKKPRKPAPTAADEEQPKLPGFEE